MLIGKLEAFQEISIFITYTTTLSISSDETFRFIIPTNIAPRYNANSNHPLDEDQSSFEFDRLKFRRTKFFQEIRQNYSFAIEIISSQLKEIFSPSHQIVVVNSSNSSMAYYTFDKSDLFLSSGNFFNIIFIIFKSSYLLLLLLLLLLYYSFHLTFFYYYCFFIIFLL